MKRVDLVRHVEAHGRVLLREGDNHSGFVNHPARRTSIIPRHREVNDYLARKICRDPENPEPRCRTERCNPHRDGARDGALGHIALVPYRRPWKVGRRREFFYDGLVPFEHFIPVREDLSDLSAQIDWAESHPDHARRIAEQGRAFACAHLCRRHALEHLGRTILSLGGARPITP